MVYQRDFLERFHERVDERGPDECWPWLDRRRSGYGILGVSNQGRRATVGAHVIALILAQGEDANGRFALHSCDNPPCCNPAHLRWGDQKQNIADMHSRGRWSVGLGVERANAKLSEDDVRAIRAAHDDPSRPTQRIIAERFGISHGTVSKIVRGKLWTHVE